MSYYAGRKNAAYYSAVRDYLAAIGPVDTLLDVGCHDTPCATWGVARSRYTVDPRPRPHLDGVVQIREAWPAARAHLPRSIDLLMCLQTIEHIRDARPFCDALFGVVSCAIIISVPYRWPLGACPYHVHDPIDFDKLRDLTGHIPTEYVIPHASPRRLVALYRVA